MTRRQAMGKPRSMGKMVAALRAKLEEERARHAARRGRLAAQIEECQRECQHGRKRLQGGLSKIDRQDFLPIHALCRN